MWSLGVLLFTMLAGETPFASGPEDSPEDILQRIGKGQYDMNSGNWATVSNLAKDIVSKMLDVNPSRRLTTGQILTHPWITSRNQPTTNLLRQDSQHLKVFIAVFDTTYKIISVSTSNIIFRPQSVQHFKLCVIRVL